MNILTNERGQVYLFATGEFGLQRKRIGDDIAFQIAQAGDALHAHPDGDPSGGEEPAFAEPHIKRVTQSGNRRGACVLQIQAGSILFSLDVQSLPLRDLANMNFH